MIFCKSTPRNSCSKEFSKFRVNVTGRVYLQKSWKRLQLYLGYTPPLSTSSNLENLDRICFLYTCSKLLLYYVRPQSRLLDTRAFSLYFFQWRHWQITSERLFNNISLESSTISIFLANSNYIFWNWGCMIYSCLLCSRISVVKFIICNFPVFSR